MVHHLQLLIESNPSWVVLKTGQNEVNSVSRANMLEEVEKSFPDIYHYVHQIYSKHNPLVFHQENSSILLTAEEGIQQGDPLGPTLFTISIHSILHDIQESHPNVQVLAYLNDVFFAGPAVVAVSALDDLRASFSKIGLPITEKCELYTANAEDLPSLSLSTHVTTSGLSVYIKSSYWRASIHFEFLP